MKSRSYRQLTQDQRYQLWALKRIGETQCAIARELGVHSSTISRELKRNCGQRGYRPRQAHGLALSRSRQRARTPRIPAATWELVEEKLQDQWSPQQIAGRLRLEQMVQAAWDAPVISVSHERIYQYVYADKRQGGTLYCHLRSQKKRRKRYGGGYSRRGQIAERRCISERPSIVQERQRIGDWEGDTIVGKGHRQAIVSLTERFSRLTLLRKVERATAMQVSVAIREELKSLGHRVHSLTVDNGKEFSLHQKIAAALKAKVYFAHPYCSWERGLNENTNGLVRQYCPKKSDFSLFDCDYLQAVAELLNHRPRKTLGYKTPFEVFYQLTNIALNT